MRNNNSNKSLINRATGLLKCIVELFSYLANYTPIYSLLRYIKKDKAIILMYHGISEKNITSLENFDGKHVHRKLFEKQIVYLKKHYNIISLNKYIKSVNGTKKLPKNPVILTFDDGYRNNFTVLLPIIRKYVFPAIIYLPTKQIGTKIIHSNASIVSFLISNTKKKDIELKVGNRNNFYDLRSKKKKLKSIIIILKKLNSLSKNEVKYVLNQIKKQTAIKLPRNDDNLFLMSWKEVMELNNFKQYMSFGSHTLTHPNLTKLTASEIKKELKSSKEELEMIFGTKIQHLAYPYGYYNNYVSEISKDVGYSSGVTTEYGYNRKGTSLFKLKRIAVSNNNNMAFFMLGLFVNLGKVVENTAKLYSRLKRILR